MLHEPAAQPDYIPQLKPSSFEPQDSQDEGIAVIRGIVGQYLEIAEEHRQDVQDIPAEDQAILARADSHLLITFMGRLREGSEMVYDALEKELLPHDQYALLRETTSEQHPHMIRIVQGRPAKPQALPVWPNALLFIATLLSVLFTGTTFAIPYIGLDNPELAQEIGGSLGSIFANIWRGWPYALSILLILVPHEMGHFLMMRRHNVAASWPYFLPGFFISPFGTFGAAILLRESLKNRKTLLDVGASGPIAGFLVAVPVVLIGLSTSRVLPMTGEGLIEGNSLVYAFSKLLVFGDVLPNGQIDVMVNQVAWAGWTGLFVTALNLIPLGQLDGGHVFFSLFGNRARRVYWPLLITLGALAFFLAPAWILFVFLLLVLGRYYAVPLDAITPLNPTRRWIGLLAIAIFVLSFTPIPLYEQGETGGLLGQLQLLGTFAVPMLIVLPRWWRMRRLLQH